MKNLKIIIAAALFALLTPAQSIAQNQLLWIHDDHVKPAMTQEYIAAMKELVEACKKHNVADVNWLMNRMDDNTFRFVVQIPNMAALDQNPFAVLEEKMGKEKLEALWTKMDKCYDHHNSFLITNSKSLTYMPNGYSVATPGMNYRKFYYFYTTASTSDAVASKIKAITDLYVKKGAKEHFRIYHSGLGCPEEFYVAVISAKDEADYQKTSDETEKLLGDEGKKAMDDLFKTASRVGRSTGWAQEDLSYSAK